MRGASVVAIVLVVVFSGCAGTEPSPSPAAEPTTTAPAPTVGVETGSVTGIVLDQEQVPIAGAQVALIEPDLRATTDAAGAFTLNEVAPGSFKIIVERLGYDSVAKRVDVLAGEVTQVNFVLKAVVVAVEGYTWSQPFSGYIELGHAWTDYYALWGPNTFCSKCVFHAFFSPRPVDIKYEAGWVKPVDAPVVSPEIYYLLRVGWSNATSQFTETGRVLTSGYWYANQPIPRQLEAGDNTTAVNNLKETKADKMQIRLGGAFNGVAFQQRVDTWLSLAYGAPFPEDFSAFPPAG